MYIFAIS